MKKAALLIVALGSILFTQAQTVESSSRGTIGYIKAD